MKFPPPHHAATASVARNSMESWRRDPESNRTRRICNPMSAVGAYSMGIVNQGLTACIQRVMRAIGVQLVRKSPPILALLLTACGGGGSSVAPAPAPAPDTRVYQVAAYGDSTQFELGDPHPAGAPGMWVKNKAYGGASAASMLAGYLDKGLPWAQEMAAQKAPVVVFNPGINDHQYTVDQYRENLRSLVTIAQAAGKFVILEEPNPAGETETPLMASIKFDVAAFEARRSAMRDLATHMGVYFCAQPRVSLRDGIHPDEAGYAIKVQRLHVCLLDAV